MLSGDTEMVLKGFKSTYTANELMDVRAWNHTRIHQWINALSVELRALEADEGTAGRNQCQYKGRPMHSDGNVRRVTSALLLLFV